METRKKEIQKSGFFLYLETEYEIGIIHQQLYHFKLTMYNLNANVVFEFTYGNK